MDPKLCRACHAPHFSDYDLCGWCSERLQHELEQRLRVDDGKASWMVIAALAVHGERKQLLERWRIG